MGAANEVPPPVQVPRAPGSPVSSSGPNQARLTPSPGAAMHHSAASPQRFEYSAISPPSLSARYENNSLF